LALKLSFGMPIGHTSGYIKRPIVTLAIIILNVAVYAITSFENIFAEVGEYWVRVGGFAPLLIPNFSEWYRIFTSMFLHADIFHILFNMYFLYLFGRAVEEALGGLRFLALYLVSGITASIFHTAFGFMGTWLDYTIPAIGASGAISGVLGAYLILYPGTSLIMGWFFPFPLFFRMKAAYYLLLWFAAQVFYGYARAAGGTAVFAHAGGFVAGIAMLALIAQKERLDYFRKITRLTPPYYLVFMPIKAQGLTRSTKIIVAILLASLLAGEAYATVGLANPGIAKSAALHYVSGNTTFMDYFGVQLPNVKEAIEASSLDITRILLNRIYAAGLLYDEVKAGREITIMNKAFRVPVEIELGAFSKIVYVNMTVKSFEGLYDDEGFLSYGEGDIATQIVKIQVTYGPNNRLYPILDYEPITYAFRISSQTTNLTSVTQYSALISLVFTAAALALTIIKDKDFAVVGEELIPSIEF